MSFSDESRSNSSYSDGRMRDNRRLGERNADFCAQERSRYGEGIVLVFGIMNGEKTRLLSTAIPILLRIGPVLDFFLIFLFSMRFFH